MSDTPSIDVSAVEDAIAADAGVTSKEEKVNPQKICGENSDAEKDSPENAGVKADSPERDSSQGQKPEPKPTGRQAPSMPASDVPFRETVNESEALGKLDSELMANSEADYREIAKSIVNASLDQLDEQNDSKKDLKNKFYEFFTRFIAVQFAILVAMILIRSIFGADSLSDQIIIVYIASVFVETLGAIILMIKYAFDSSQETSVLKILNGVISNYQKFKNGDGEEGDKKKKRRK